MKKSVSIFVVGFLVMFSILSVVSAAEWTSWFNRDTSGGSGDYETLGNFISGGYDVCSDPIDYQCNTTAGVPCFLTGEKVHCSNHLGCYCKNSEQGDGYCNYNYMVRFLCGEGTVNPLSNETDGGHNPFLYASGDSCLFSAGYSGSFYLLESSSNYRSFCPYGCNATNYFNDNGECNQGSGPVAQEICEDDGYHNYDISTFTSVKVLKTDGTNLTIWSGDDHCNGNYAVDYACNYNVGGTYTWTLSSSQSYCPYGCTDGSCNRWTDWFNRDNSGGSGDYETLINFINEGYDVCTGPVDIECQTTTGLDYTATGEVVTCNPSVGLYCKNSLQPDGYCNYNYKVRFLCHNF